MRKPAATPDFMGLVTQFSSAFSRQAFQTFNELIAGWILCLHVHTVTGVIKAGDLTDKKHFSTYERFFSAAQWTFEALWEVLVRRLLRKHIRDKVVYLIGDDTLCRHRGPHIDACQKHFDPHASTKHLKISHRGHLWVALALLVKTDVTNHPLALPVNARLYRDEECCAGHEGGHEECDFGTRSELMNKMIEQLHRWLPDVEFIFVADNQYANKTMLKNPIPGTTLICRTRLNAVVHAAPVSPGRRRPRGRPPQRGVRLRKPVTWAEKEDEPWQDVTVVVNLRERTLQFKVRDVLWTGVAGKNPVRMVLVKGWPGKAEQLVSLCCSNTRLSAGEIIRYYCARWNIEVTFHEAKTNLGMKDPQNRAYRAVERTAVLSLLLYSLVVLYYLELVESESQPALVQQRWYTKTHASFADMLEATRRNLWARRFSSGMAGTHVPPDIQEALMSAACVGS